VASAAFAATLAPQLWPRRIVVFGAPMAVVKMPRKRSVSSAAARTSTPPCR